MKKHVLLSTGIVLLFGLSACDSNTAPQQLSTKAKLELPVGMTKINSVQKADDEIVIPFTQYELANGLTVVLHSDKSDPLAHVDITYHVGSGREEPGK